MIVAGFGCRGKASTASLRAALARAQAGRPLVDALAAPADKAASLAGLADALGLPLIAVPAETLRAIETPTRSAISLGARGTGSVAEAVAIAAAGADARLIAPRHISPDRMATCAIAEGLRA